jgi:hypothetical protein
MTTSLKNSEVQLSVRENTELELWNHAKSPPLPLANAIKLYELFLNGYSCEEIFRVNGGKIPLGQIVDARIRYQWDERKSQQLESVYGNIEQKVLKTKNDAVLHITDSLAAAHKLMGDRIKMFLQEGNPELLGGMDLTNLKTYKELLQMLVTLTSDKSTGKSKDVQIHGAVKHVHTVVTEESRALSSGDAAKVLDLLDANGVEDE